MDIQELNGVKITLGGKREILILNDGEEVSVLTQYQNWGNPCFDFAMTVDEINRQNWNKDDVIKLVINNFYADNMEFPEIPISEVECLLQSGHDISRSVVINDIEEIDQNEPDICDD